MMARIGLYSSARSDYGPQRRLISILSDRCELDVMVAGGHHALGGGNTIDEIRTDAAVANANLVPVEFAVDGGSGIAHAKAVGLGIVSIAQLFAMRDYDMVVCIGDRWELFCLTVPALVARIPIAHISGGEVTEGVIDDCVRHATSKLSHLHFVANECYAANLSRMGEEDWRITVSGECGLDTIHRDDIASREDIAERFSVDLGEPTILVTFHPSTLDLDTPVDRQIGALLDALESCGDFQIVFTAPGVEQGAEVVRRAIEEFVARNGNSRFVPHFGSRNYLRVLRESRLVLGNSSSGLTEAASFRKPAVNIGDRQKNRMAAESVLHAGYDAAEILARIRMATSVEFDGICRSASNPYDPWRDGRNSERIAHALLRALATRSRTALLHKKFLQDVDPAEWNRLLEGFE